MQSPFDRHRQTLGVIVPTNSPRPATPPLPVSVTISIPDEVLTELPVTGPWTVTRTFMARAAEQELAIYEERPASRFWQFVLASNGAFILRPVRLLETASYFFPPKDFLYRRYGKANIGIKIYHLLKAFLQTLIFIWDTFSFGMERYFRLKRMGKKTSLFNTLETDL